MIVKASPSLATLKVKEWFVAHFDSCSFAVSVMGSM